MNRVMTFLGVVVGMAVLAADASAFSASYDQKTTMGRQVYNSKMALKDQFFRMEMTADGQNMIIIRNAEGTYTVMPSEGMAMKTANLRPGQGPPRGADNYAQYLQQQKAEKIGAETIEGRACDIYRYTDSETGDVVTAWVWKEKCSH